MALKALHTVKTGGKIYKAGEILPKLSKEDTDFLVGNRSAVEVEGADAKPAGKVSIEELTLEIVNGLKQKELLAIAKEMELTTDDNKAATLKAAIIEAISEEVVDLDEMDEADLVALAAVEGVDLPEGASAEEMRDILADALAE